jgi:hypothetical protein
MAAWADCSAGATSADEGAVSRWYRWAANSLFKVFSGDS